MTGTNVLRRSREQDAYLNNKGGTEKVIMNNSNQFC